MTVTNPYRYTGREFDTETSIYYYRARYYDPTTGRFLNEDPTGSDGGINFYDYVVNDPVDWTDTDGTQRDRGTTGQPSGTPNPFKHMKPDPDDPGSVVFHDKKTGRDFKKAKPAGFDDYWKKKHPQYQPKKCPTKPTEPAKQTAVSQPPLNPIPYCPGFANWDWCLPNPNRQPIPPLIPLPSPFGPVNSPALPGVYPEPEPIFVPE